MWHSKSSLQILVIVSIFLFSAFVVNTMLAQENDPVTMTPTAIPSETPLPTATPTYTETPTATLTYTPTYTATYTATATMIPPTATATDTAIPPTATYTPSFTATAIPTDMPTLTATPTLMATDALPTATSTPLATDSTVPTATVPSVDVGQPTQTPTLIASATEMPSATATATSVGPLTVLQAEPAMVTSGQSATLSLIGANFSEDTTVRLMGFGFLQTTFINTTSLTAAIPSSLPIGGYVIQVSDPTTGTALAPTALTVIAAPVTPTATAVTSATPKPTDIPGEPDLVVRSFSASPDTIHAGETTQITAEIVNVGSRTAEGIVVSLGDGTFSPANGQASVTVQNLATGAVSVITMSVTAPADAKEGAASIPLVLSSRDFSGTTYRDDAVVSVNIVESIALVSQVVLTNYTVAPTAALPGDTVNVDAVVTNTGNATASQVMIQLDSANGVLIAGSQGNTFTIGELKPKSSQTVTMPLIVADGAAEGVQGQNFTITYLQDGESKQSAASISLQVNKKEALVSQVSMKGYTVEPTAALPGETVNVQAVLTNTGNGTASQVMVQLNDTNAVLIAGAQGNSFTVGDLQPNASTTVIMPLVVANNAAAGVQAQTFTINYLQDGEAKQATVSISLEIKPVIATSPVLLLQSYSTGEQGADSALEPGEQFTYKMTLQNAGTQGVSGLLVTFGTVKTDTTTASTSTSTSTTASTSFATIGSGDTVFVGDVEAGKSIDVNQQFIVNSDVDSGIYNLPITLKYVAADGSSQQQSLNANLVVVVQPRLRVSQTTTLTEPLTARQSYTLAIKIENLGATDASLSKMTVKGDNITVTEGAETLLGTLSSNDDTTESVKVTPLEAGNYTITVDVEYLDALNHAQTYTTTLTGTVAQAARVTPTPATTTTQTTQTQSLLERILLGFLGMGG